MSNPTPHPDRARELFDAALERAPQERTAFLDAACAGDAALRRALDSLLALHSEAEQTLREPTPARTEQPGDHIGPYRLVARIGEGGFGTVFLAQQDQPIQRQVALKVLKLGMDTRQVVARFDQERHALARMDHPNIARVLDAGATHTGRPYFVMDLVQGVPITAYCDQHSLPIGERLELFGQVCAAIEHAHQKGIIHRDIKPANILVGTQDGRPVAKVIDFGIAKATSGKLTELTLFTLQRQVIGTLQYMSPEQADSSPDIDTRADVYSLGVVLYELLTGSTPFAQQAVPDPRRIRELEPPKPSTRVAEVPDALAAIAEHRRTRPRHLGAILRGELDWIVMRALEKDRQRRYDSASGLAADIRRHLDGEAILAGPPGRLYRLRKAAQRHRFAIAVSSGMVAAIGLFLLALQAKNVQLRARNTDLLAATRQAHASALEAGRQEGIARSKLALAEEHRVAAEASERQAQELEARARAERARVFKLSAFRTLEDLTQEAQELWPVDSRLVDRYREWMRKAEALVASLPELRSALAELEQRALPRSAEELAKDRASHPLAAELRRRIATLGWWKRMLGEEPWPSEAAVEQALSQEPLPTDADALDALAWAHVDPDQPVYGAEVRDLLLARRAVAAAAAADRPRFRLTLAWALLKLGRSAAALAEVQAARDQVQESQRAEYTAALARMERSAAAWRDPGDQARDQRQRARADLARSITQLTSAVERRRVWRFPKDASGNDTGDRWWHDRMTHLVATLEDFAHPQRGLMHGVSEAHGLGIGKRLEFAATVAARTVSGADAQQAWNRALAAIAASPRYGGWQPRPRPGLLPIGPDPESGLWEFAHLLSGEVPQRGPDGKLILTEATGLVLVLLPGGTFWMGAQKSDPAGRNHDPRATEFETPVREVTIAPFFLAKHELTQSQWQRFTGRNPSRYRSDNFGQRWSRSGSTDTGLHPVEQVTWQDADQVLRRMGLTLPSSAEWEYGCRGGTSSVYWCGDEVASLAHVANLADAYAHTHGGEGWGEWEDGIDDGNLCHAPIGSYRANAFGLHDVHGNVAEWCLEMHQEELPGAGRHSTRIARGGAFRTSAFFARSAFLDLTQLDARQDMIGMRPAAPAEPMARSAGRLRVGDAAPPLTIAEWIHGVPVAELERGKPYVIALWSSACEGCKANLATFELLQERHADRGLRVLAVASPREEPGLAATRRFARSRSAPLRIALAWDQDNRTTDAYGPAGADLGHPAVIVDPHGRVAFIGKPASCPAALLALEHAQWDAARARGWVQRLEALLEAETPQGPAVAQTLAAIDALLAECPPLAAALDDLRFGLLLRAGRLDQAYALGARLVREAGAASDAGRLNLLAWVIVDPESPIERRDLDLALRAAARAVELEPENWYLLDTLARTHFWRKDFAQAVALQRKAVQLTDDAAARQSLREYEAAAAPLKK